ncbi:uncharacterized protein LOC120137040, partial [Hibiscus syriacus]|uniref:uncharacterized protein LOC120137040 n=1 Tax=Hibiscus syriacus TaxID=106335 RepID=UPI0019212628
MPLLTTSSLQTEEFGSFGRKELIFLSVTLLPKSITVNCSYIDSHFIITAIYGNNCGPTRRILWQTLKDIDHRFGSLPWILGGDFNNFLDSKESSDSDLLGPYISPDMVDFQNVTQDLSLQDHPFFGPTFTWSNIQRESYIAMKLYRVLINSLWATTFQNSFVEFTTPGPSDHCMGLAWPSHGNHMQKLFTKLKRLKPCLHNLNHDHFSNISAKVKQKKAKLNHIQIETLKGTSSIDKELIAQKELKDLEDSEHMFLKHKSKIQWIKDGDKCTKLFHSSIASKNKRDTIRVLFNNDGKRLDSYDAITSEIIDFFKHHLGEDVINAIKYFFKEAHISPALNSTKIALIPKIPNPSKIKDYRHISCCSVVYKTVTKILVKRLNLLLPDLISLNQTAFVKGISIIDNTLIAQELVKGLPSHLLSELKLVSGKLGFNPGFLPVRYLGVPLVTRKLTAKYCLPLIENIKQRLHHWSGKLLSYADMAATGARISWENLCCPKSEGGTRSLWVAWIHSYVIKCNNFNDINESSSYSWCSMKLIKLRSEALHILSNGISKTRDLWEEIRVHKAK